MKFISRYSHDKEITIRQYTIEVICENKAKLKGSDLPERFWTLKEWANFFKSQLRRYDYLSNSHSSFKLLAFIKVKRIYSLHAKWIDQALDEFVFVEPSTESQEEIDRSNINATGSNYKKKNDVMDKLNE